MALKFKLSVKIVVNKRRWVKLACYRLSETRPRIGNWKHLPAFCLTWREIFRYCKLSNQLPPEWISNFCLRNNLIGDLMLEMLGDRRCLS